MKAAILTLHRYLGLGLALLWILQALTGVALVFRWELDDASVAGASRPFAPAAIERRIHLIEAERPGWAASSIWSSATGGRRYDITLENPSTGEARTWRVDGQGGVLRTMDSGERVSNGALYDTLNTFHQTLFLGDRGHWIIGVSGLLLASNILLALSLALPRIGRWRAALVPTTRGPVRAWSYAWHRALGLWLCLPAAILALCGAAISFEDPLRGWLGGETAAPAVPPMTLAAAQGVTPGQAMRQALARYPDAAISGVVFPSADAPWYRIRLLQPDEPRQAFGRTTVYISGEDGRLLSDYDTTRAGWRLRVFDLLYPVHTGQMLGPAGRTVVLLVGAWLAAMCGLGVVLWSSRRQRT